MPKEETIEIINREKDPCETCGYAEGSLFCLQYCPYDAEKKKEQEPCEKCVYSTKNGYCQYDDVTEAIPPLEPCDDAISRERALEPYKGLNDDDVISVWMIKKNINELPSVTHKSGKWLITPMSNIVYCSECDYLFKDIPASIVEHFKYCPNCGAEMEESEVAE